MASDLSNLRYLGQVESRTIDEDLMDPKGIGYTLPQLMELAGQSTAHAILDAYPSAKRILVLCGPGNNGGDGVVAARHLHHFSVDTTVYLPKPFKNPEVQLFVQQNDEHGIRRIDQVPSLDELSANYDLICDALFGFSFKVDPQSPQPIRAPYDQAVKQMVQTNLPIVALDFPSGWDVEKGPTLEKEWVIQPQALVSLTAPKLGAKAFHGRHYLGGLFVPRKVAEKYDLSLPPYPPGALFMEFPPEKDECSL
mmetsp:Transcript_37986/g.60043  ORF Transcript_37986/g.60043 Transcript_37986/m.60043 type:complete len:252 (-) Transcript_37986:139-894(-)